MPPLAVAAMRAAAVTAVAAIVFVKSKHAVGSFRSYGAKIYLKNDCARIERYIFRGMIAGAEELHRRPPAMFDEGASP
jgi:hypothetical protein